MRWIDGLVVDLQDFQVARVELALSVRVADLAGQ